MLTNREVDDLFDGTTFGMEYDCGEFDRHAELPEGHTWCVDEVAAHSAAGVGADPTLRYNMFGGEVQTAPAASEGQLLQYIDDILRACLPHDKLRFSSTIHVHVRVPKLLERPDLLKYLVKWCTAWTPELSQHWYKWDDADYDHLPEEARAYYKWSEECNRRVKTQVYDDAALRRMDLAPDTPREIACALHDNPRDWKNEWTYALDDKTRVHRPAINFGHLALNETIEFRCFQATTDRAILRNICGAPLNILRMALTNDPDPARVVRGVQFQDNFTSTWEDDTASKMIITGKTSLYYTGYTDYRNQIAIGLINGDLTVADLNYPKYWLDRGFQ